VRTLVLLLATIGCLVAVAPAAASAPPKADIVFILDESGSMGEEIADVRAQINRVASAVAAKADARYALVGFGGGYTDAPPSEPRTRSDFTDPQGLARALAGSGAFPGGGGGRELGLAATSYALTALGGFRTDAGTCALLMSDEPPAFKTDRGSDMAAAIAALRARNATWFGIVPASDPLVRETYGPAPGSLAHESGGAVFALGSFRANSGEVLAAILSHCVRTVVEKGPCTIMGTAGPDVLRGTPGNDVICGLGGADRILASGGDDLVFAGAGNDRVAGGAGKDRLLGGTGSDRLLGGQGADALRAGAGRDVLVGGGGSDLVRGERGRDRILARDGGRDLVRGGGGLDSARARPGPDRLRSIERLL